MQFNKYTHTHTHPPWEDQCEWHRMTRMTGPDYAVMCNLINTHTHTHTHSKGHRRDRQKKTNTKGQPNAFPGGLLIRPTKRQHDKSTTSWCTCSRLGSTTSRPQVGALVAGWASTACLYLPPIRSTHTDARPGREEETARLGQADARRLGGRYAGRTNLIPLR